MKNPFAFIFPGLLAGIGCLILITGLLTTPNETAQAASIPVTGSTRPAPTPTKAAANKAKPAQTSAQVKITCTLPTRYPETIRRWCDLIQQEAQKNGIEARLIAAVMLQESGGNPKAYSKSGAVGLMQIMPRDGLAAAFQCKNGPCFSTRPSMAELYDPDFNVNFGARMLAGLIKKQGGVREALKAYGPMDMGYAYADKVLAIYSNYK